LQNKKDLLFCGSYFGYGFHEDGIKSSIEMLKNF
jgi:predicted NAD/FAD-binding protein